MTDVQTKFLYLRNLLIVLFEWMSNVQKKDENNTNILKKRMIYTNVKLKFYCLILFNCSKHPIPRFTKVKQHVLEVSEICFRREGRSSHFFFLKTIKKKKKKMMSLHGTCLAVDIFYILPNMSCFRTLLRNWLGRPKGWYWELRYCISNEFYNEHGFKVILEY